MAKGQRYECGVWRHSYKALPHLFAFKGFWETAPTIGASPISPQQQGGPLPGLSRNRAHTAHLSPQFVMARRIFADFSTNRYGSVITTVQSLL